MSERIVNLTVLGNPYSKARPRVTARGTYTPRVQKANADALAWDIKIACGHQPFTRNVAVGLRFYRADRQRIDLDNLVKQVLDAANGVAWVDDSQVTMIVARLGYDAANPRTVISIKDDDSSSMERGENMLREKSCERCGVTFGYRPYPSQKPPRYCSRDCTLNASCEECGEPFHKADRRQRFCSKPCASRSKLTRARIAERRRAAARPKATCRDCGVELARFNAVLCRPCWLDSPNKRRKAEMA